jgi:hypothetical protein
MNRNVARSCSVVQRVDAVDPFLGRAFWFLAAAAVHATPIIKPRQPREPEVFGQRQGKRRNIAAELYCACAIPAAGRKLRAISRFRGVACESNFLEDRFLRIRIN